MKKKVKLLDKIYEDVFKGYRECLLKLSGSQ